MTTQNLSKLDKLVEITKREVFPLFFSYGYDLVEENVPKEIDLDVKDLPYFLVIETNKRLHIVSFNEENLKLFNHKYFTLGAIKSKLNHFKNYAKYSEIEFRLQGRFPVFRFENVEGILWALIWSVY